MPAQIDLAGVILILILLTVFYKITVGSGNDKKK